MNRTLCTVAAAVTLALLASCAGTPDPGQNAATDTAEKPTVSQVQVMIEVMQDSPTAYIAFRGSCVDEVVTLKTVDRQILAELMDVEVNAVPLALCERIMTSLRNGTLTAQDYVDVSNGKNLVPALHVIRQPL